MTTVQSLELEREAASQVEILAEAQHGFISVLRRQLQAANAEAVMFRGDALSAEKNAEKMADKINDICEANALGTHGSPLEQLQRIAGMLELLNEALNEVNGKLNELRAEFDAATPREKAAR